MNSIEHQQNKPDFTQLDYWKKVEEYFLKFKYEEWDDATKYALDVYFKRILTSKMVRYATARHLLFLYRWKYEEDFPFFYDFNKIEQIKNFANKLKITNNRHFIFLDFRKFIAGFTFGWNHKETPRRLITREIFDVEARKQGKSSFWAMIMLASAKGLMGRKNAKIFIAGPVRDSSKILYNLASEFIIASPKIRKQFKKVNTLQLVSNENSIIKALPFEDNVLEGQDPSLVVLTEYHMHPDDRMYQSAKRAISSFNNNISIVFDTTKGDEAHTVCFERERTYKQQLEWQIYNPTEISPNFSVFLYCAELDEEDIPFWEDSNLWIKANPLLNDPVLGKTLLVALKDELANINSESEKRSFATKRLGIWAGSGSTYFNYFEVYESNKQSKQLITKQIESNFKGYNAIMGVDLSSNLDITCITLLFQIPIDEKTQTKENITWAFKSWSFIPEATVVKKEKTDKVPYRDWAKKGWLEITPGNSIDYAYIAEKIIDIKTKYNVIMIGYDGWHFSMIKDILLKSGKVSEKNMEEVKQGIHLTESFKIFETALKRQKIHFMDNEININHVLNVTAKEIGANNNLKISKTSAYDRIDNFMAMLTATALLFKVHPTRYKLTALVVDVKLERH